MSRTDDQCHAVRDRGLFLRDCLTHEAISAAHHINPCCKRIRHLSASSSSIFPSDKHSTFPLAQPECTEINPHPNTNLHLHLHHDAGFNSVVSMGDPVLFFLSRHAPSAFKTQEIHSYQDRDLFLRGINNELLLFCCCFFISWWFPSVKNNQPNKQTNKQRSLNRSGLLPSLKWNRRRRGNQAVIDVRFGQSDLELFLRPD